MHKWLNDKNKLHTWVQDYELDNEGSDEDSSSSNRSLKGDEALAEACGELDKSRKEHKSKA